MEIRILRYFLAVAREENMTRAAEMLHVAQPTLSKALKSTESPLNIADSQLTSGRLSTKAKIPEAPKHRGSLLFNGNMNGQLRGQLFAFLQKLPP